jgi:hypothetical protein
MAGKIVKKFEMSLKDYLVSFQWSAEHCLADLWGYLILEDVVLFIV